MLGYTIHRGEQLASFVVDDVLERIMISSLSEPDQHTDKQHWCYLGTHSYCTGIVFFCFYTVSV